MSTQITSIIDELILVLNKNAKGSFCPVDALMHEIIEYKKLYNDSIFNRMIDFLNRKKFIYQNDTTYSVANNQVLYFFNDLKFKLSFPNLLVIDDAKKELYQQLLDQIDGIHIHDNSNIDDVYNELSKLLHVWEEINHNYDDRSTTPFFEFTGDDYNRKETINLSTILDDIMDNDDDFEINRKISLLLEEFKNQVKEGDNGVCGYRFDW